MIDLRGVFTGAVLRAIAGIRDAGESIAAYVGSDDKSEASEVADDKSDVWVKVIDERGGGRQLIGRLHIPGNILFAKPKDGGSVTVLRPTDTAAPGAYLVIYGDGGDADTVPSWFGDNDAGLYFAKKLHVESTSDDVELKASGFGKKVTVNGSDYHMPKWDPFANALATFINTLAAQTIPTNTATLITAVTNIINAAITFQTALNTNSNYASTKAYNG